MIKEKNDINYRSSHNIYSEPAGGRALPVNSMLLGNRGGYSIYLRQKSHAISGVCGY